ncbi:hypothetical protein Tco_0632368 [Tanacetum coccineum]
MSLTGQRSPWLPVMLQGEIDSDLVSIHLLSLKPPMGSVTRAYAYVGFYFCKLVIFFVLFKVIVDKVVKYFVKDVAQGAATTCYIALNPKVKGVTNKYFSDSKTDYCNIKSWLDNATLPKDTIATPPVAETKACDSILSCSESGEY